VDVYEVRSGASREPPRLRSAAARDVATFFDERALRYDGEFDALGPDGYALRTRLAVTLRLLGEGPGELLDVGMGPGRLLAECEARGWTVSGLDGSAEMVARSRQRVPAAGERLVRGDAERLPFADGSFDAVSATGVLEYVTDLGAALREVARVLRPHGRAVLSMPNPFAPYALWLYAFRRHTTLSRKSSIVAPRRFVALIEEVQLPVDAVQYTNPLIVPRPFDRRLAASSVRIAERAERLGSPALRLLGTQVVVGARRAP
jgi:demethylmenaquinone methyltransferase/2-methoxy-6-polyprenyl-1,4-benzoquinol methylase